MWKKTTNDFTSTSEEHLVYRHARDFCTLLFALAILKATLQSFVPSLRPAAATAAAAMIQSSQRESLSCLSCAISHFAENAGQFVGSGQVR